MNPMIRNSVALMFASFLINSCMLVEPDKGKMGTCRTLKSDIVFNGATSNDRQATIENSEAALIQHTYDRDCT